MQIDGCSNETLKKEGEGGVGGGLKWTTDREGVLNVERCVVQISKIKIIVFFYFFYFCF